MHTHIHWSGIMCSFCFGLLPIFQLMDKIKLSHTAATTEFMFRRVNAAIVTDHEFRLAATSWSGVSSILSCARITINECPWSRGFVYASGVGQCRPLLSVQDGSGVTSASVPDGEFYLTTDNGVTCPEGFQSVEYEGSSRTYTLCVTKIVPATTYAEATRQCSNLTGYLGTVKTKDKLAMLATLSPYNNLWIGLDDLANEGTYIWQEDGTEFTPDQWDGLFGYWQPNNLANDEHCVHYQWNRVELHDNNCGRHFIGLCESRPLHAHC